MGAMKELYEEVFEKLTGLLEREPSPEEISAYWEENKNQVVAEHLAKCPKCAERNEQCHRCEEVFCKNELDFCRVSVRYTCKRCEEEIYTEMSAASGR